MELNKNITTTAGYVCVGAGGSLALAVGLAVLPGPTVGLALAGGGLVVAGNYQSIKEHFSGDSSDKVSVMPKVTTPTPAQTTARQYDVAQAVEQPPITTYDGVEMEVAAI
jgi:hypothetical protein